MLICHFLIFIVDFALAASPQGGLMQDAGGISDEIHVEVDAANELPLMNIPHP
jgi:hypothetical protein